MDYALYKRIVEEIHRYNGKDVLATLQSLFPTIGEGTLGSIISQDYQRKVAKSYYKHQNPNTMKFYYDSYVQLSKNECKTGSSLLKLAVKHDISPCLMARIIIEQYLIANQRTVTKRTISSVLKDSTQIEDKQLSTDVHLCVITDDHYGPMAETIKQSIGFQYEFDLKQRLRKLKIPFVEEDQLRTEGYDKTPDVKLEIPISVNGRVVNWIESKASFGDPDNHKSYLKEQFWSYWNRFGSGLVIYWFGFVKELDEYSDKDGVTSYDWQGVDRQVTRWRYELRCCQ